jgi:hypothetical protein
MQVMDNSINEWQPLRFVYHVINCAILKYSNTEIMFACKFGSSSQYYFHKIANEIVSYEKITV